MESPEGRGAGDMKFRKKPVVIEAIKVNDLTAEFFQRKNLWPPWATEAFESGVMQVGEHSVQIKTLEGEMVGAAGDWIIRGVKGELYPCKPDIFAATYEAVAE
jgi:hypothetical protein